jgi:taurine dioxygenase
VQPDSRASSFGPGAFAIRPLGSGFGAEIVGLDLRLPLTRECAQRIEDAFLAHHLVVVRDQELTRRQMGDFAALFGELEGNIVRNADGSTLEAIHEISNLDARGVPAEDSYIKSNYHWHTDKAYLPVPALLTMLHAIELPQSGGDTSSRT